MFSSVSMVISGYSFQHSCMVMIGRLPLCGGVLSGCLDVGPATPTTFRLWGAMGGEVV